MNRMRLIVFPPRPRGSKVAEHVVAAFRARVEVALNGINYLREEYMLCRNALRFGETELYMHGYTKRPYWRKRGQRNQKDGTAEQARRFELQEARWQREERMWREEA